MNYEELLEFCDDVRIKEMPLLHNLKGLYRDNRIIIHSQMTQRQKRCILGEELGHHFTTVGNILNPHPSQNAKQERQARGWSSKQLIPLRTLAKALTHCTHEEELLDYLDVTPEFFLESITYFQSKYGPYYDLGTHYLVFEPLHLVTKSQLNMTEKACPTP